MKKTWKKNVYRALAKVWMGRNAGERFNAIDMGNMLKDDLETGMFHQHLLNAMDERLKKLRYRLLYRLQGRKAR
ncbi:MAG: hypothetical protein PHU95_02320 [Candidatus Thermoplasmatota archaeon]|nr:hypothetical protein [Candidatus Thermoplasmatota archaeon]MDD5778267.1 hypothetical protein [Candidatus Thermoplasmatota archaeon]